MSTYGYDILSTQAPLILGILFFVLLIKFNPSLKRFVVQYNKRQLSPNTSCETPQYPEKTREYLYDQLLTKGILVNRALQSLISQTAFDSLGILEPCFASRYLTACKGMPHRIRLLTSSDSAEIRSLLTEKSRACGLLLAYLLDSRLEFMVIE